MRRLKRLLLLLLALDIAMFVTAALVALKLKQTRENVGDEDSNEFDLSTIFDGLEFASRAPAFRHGAWLAYFGGGKLDLSGARLDPAGVTLQLRAVMGGGEVTVPRDCRVELSTRAIMGGVQDETTEADPTADLPTLAIEAFTLMGGFQIVRGEAPASVETAPESAGDDAGQLGV